VKSLERFVRSTSAEWGEPGFARWASILFCLSVLTYLLSIAASQACLAAAGVCYFVHLLHRKPPVDFPPVKLPLLLFCFLTFLSALCAANPTIGMLVVRKLVLFLIMLFTVNAVASPAVLELLYGGLFVESALAGLVGAAQFVLHYRAVVATHPGEVYFKMAFEERICGFMGHWMLFSGQQMLVFAALLAFLMLGERRSRLWGLLLGVIAASIVLSLTRGVWLGCFVAAVYLLARWKPKWLWALPVLAVLAYSLAPSILRERVQMALRPSSDPAVFSRLEFWRAGVAMMKAHPWLGVGPNNIESELPLYVPHGSMLLARYHGHLHDNFIQLGAERGLPALLAWVWFMVAVAGQTWRVRRRLTQARWVADAALAAWLAFLVEGIFEFNFGTSPVLMLFLFIISTPFLLERLQRNGREATRGRPATL
jgi:putative inorganic carbon (HCO3(-)) transporter